MDSLHFREALKSDLSDILRLYAQPDLDDGNILSTSDAERMLERMASYPNYKIVVAVNNARIVGTFVLLIMDHLGHQGMPSAIIEDVAVDPSLHGQGIGKKMMHHAIKLATENNCYKAVLSSNLKRERAHAFYESLGLERHGYSFRIDTQQAVAADHVKPCSD
ncbi:MAG: GNAT family N-acetyltransferase [Candidatus Contendobacter sp.]|nr:GNAT family N-acetyltransferase [Candidatus Contendobacter sp.]MDS4058413.1 GNAT family N-acetyltransferase [Candidatus Contendobacter sp.]